MMDKVWLYWTLWTVNWGTLAQTRILVMDGKIRRWLCISCACLGEQLVQKRRQGQTSVNLFSLSPQSLFDLRWEWKRSCWLGCSHTRHKNTSSKLSRWAPELEPFITWGGYCFTIMTCLAISDQRSCSCCYRSRAAFTNLYIYLHSHLCLKRGINLSGIISACLHYCLGNTS